MDAIYKFAVADFQGFKAKHLFGKPGSSPLNLYNDPSLWDWSQLWNPKDFAWKSGITPLADLAVLYIDIDDSIYLDCLLCRHHVIKSIHVQ
jgi:hypothetical protein